MADRKTICVVGSTGAQGGGLCRAIAGDAAGRFQARGLTRNVRSDKAAELARLGVELIEADLDDLESLVRAFDGAYGAYCVTNFWEHFSPDRERQQAANMAEAAQRAALEHVVWSTLEDTRHWVPLEDERMPTLMGKYKVPHFDAKGESDAEFRSRGVSTTFLLTSFYWDNFIHFGMGPRRGPDGTLAIALPMADQRLPGIAAQDIGCCAYGIFARGSEHVGKSIGIAAEQLTGDEMAATFAEVLGEPVGYQAISPDDYRGLGFPGAEDLGNMFQFKRDFNDDFCRMRDPQQARELCPAMQSFVQWLTDHRERIPLQ